MKENQLRWGGNAGRDAEKKEFGGGSFYVVPVAHTEKGKDGGEDKTTWLDIICFSEWSRKVAADIKKGDNVVAFGRLSIKDTEKDGKSYRNVSMVAQQIGVIKRFDEKTSTSPDKPSVDEIPF